MARKGDKRGSGRAAGRPGGAGAASGRARPASGDAGTAGTTERGRQGYAVGARTARRGTGPDRRVLMVVGGVVLLVAVALGAWLLLFRDSASGFDSAMTAGGCVEQTFPNQGAGLHLTDEEPAPTYPSDPPTQGKHRVTPALWGIYDEPIEEARLVHNLEHGGLVVQYGDKVPVAQVTHIKDDVLANRDLTVVSPYPKLGSKVAYTMWTRLITCERYERGVLDELQKRRNQAPAPEVPQNPALGRRPGY